VLYGDLFVVYKTFGCCSAAVVHIVWRLLYNSYCCCHTGCTAPVV